MTPHACLLLLASLAPLALQQEAGPAPPERANRATASPWQLVNQVEVVVNEDVLTLRQLQGQLRQELARQPISTQAEMAALRREILDRQIEHLLMVQRGRDLGFDPEHVQRAASSHIQTQAQGAGGIADLAEILAERGETAVSRKQTITDELYALSFDGAITGRAPGPGGRPMRDRYVRPGQISQAYEQLKQQPAGARLIGGTVETFVLQQLVISVEHFAGEPEAREFAEDLRQQALAGDDFDALVATFSLEVEDERGLTRPLNLAELDAISPAIAEFCAGSPIGAISQVFPIQERGRTMGFRLLRLHAHQPAELPALGDPKVQDRLRRLWLRNHDIALREEAVRQLFETSYVWSPQGVRAPDRERPTPGAAEPESAPSGPKLEAAVPGAADDARPPGEPAQPSQR